MSSLIRTSQTHPLRIATISMGDHGGAIGLTFAPGKRQTAAMTGIGDRDLAADLAAILLWGAQDLITLLEPHELEELAIPDLPTQARGLGLRWHGLPVTDGESPDHRFWDRWITLGPQLVSKINAGARSPLQEGIGACRDYRLLASIGQRRSVQC
jgi:hypothetical protein